MISPSYGFELAAISLIVSANVLFAATSALQQERREWPAEESPFVLHVTTREVVMDVIAVDGHNRTVSDLRADELSVSERVAKFKEIPELVSGFRLVDPSSTSLADPPANGFRIALNESCLQRYSTHYEVAYHPGSQALAEGNHEVHITTSRRGVRLFYRHDYYVGATSSRKAEVSRTKEQRDQLLLVNACSHLLVSPSISLRAAQISTGSRDTIRYKLNIDSSSLAFISFSNGGRGLQLDYAACNFDLAGKPINFMTAATEEVLTAVEYARAEAQGLLKIMELAAPVNLAITRFVVRDRSTGNIGLADVLVELPQKASSTEKAHALDGAIQKALAVQERNAPGSDVSFTRFNNYGIGDIKALPGPVGSYGSVVPNKQAFCGDVFELEPGVRLLPDFRPLDPIGSVYTTSLVVPYQDLPPQTGIPRITDRIAWFGVDYHASFWIRVPGRYEFKLMSDDGAKLQIDDKWIVEVDGLHTPKKGTGDIVLDAGRHSIHVPYFEGTPTGVALVLWVRPPQGTWKILDLRDFEMPVEESKE